MRNRGPIAVAAIFGVVGIALLLIAASTALRHFEFNTFDCGSVVSAKDPAIPSRSERPFPCA